MSTGWAFCGTCCLVSAAIVNPLAGAFGAIGGAILLLVYINHTMGNVVRLAIKVVRAFTYDRDTLIDDLQALSIAMIRWRKI